MYAILWILVAIDTLVLSVIVWAIATGDEDEVPFWLEEPASYEKKLLTKKNAPKKQAKTTVKAAKPARPRQTRR